jgi:hypothetical protein
MPPNPCKLDIKIHPDPVLAPRYDATTKQLELVEAVITTEATGAKIGGGVITLDHRAVTP